MTSLRIAVPLLAALAAAHGAHAQEKYPVRPVRLIVPFTPGGGTDIIARIIAQKATEALGQSVIVDNRPGGGGTVGAETAVRANPDGYTLGFVSTSYSTNPSLYKLPYDALNDIQPVILVGQTGYVVALNPALPVKSVKELIAHSKANPGKLNYASTGTGGATHLATVLFEVMADIRMTHIPYKGTGPALSDLIGGQIQMMIGAMPASVPQVKAGRLRGVGVTTLKRIATLPDTPVVADTVPGYEAVSRYGLIAPKGLPPRIVALWNKEVTRILETDEMKARLATEAIDPIGGTPEAFRNALRDDIAKWGKVVKAAKITLSN